MINANMISVPLEVKTSKNDVVLSEVITSYPDQNNYPTQQTGNLIAPLSVKTKNFGQENITNPDSYVTEITYDKYDNDGNIIQYTTKGLTTTIIWGYNNTLPIAKIEGATYADVQNAAASIISASNSDGQQNKNNDESALISALYQFRKQFPNAMITTYTHDPLIGVRSITGSNGMTEFYIYDQANRLKEVRDINNNILKEYTYKFKQ